jgi:23S rRNA pseudouridine2605 synthase
MAGHSRSKNGVASLAYVPAIHVFLAARCIRTWMPGTRPGMTNAETMSDKSNIKNGPEDARPATAGRRIAKVIARAGLASRREAEAWIAAGRVAVNGAVVTSPAINVAPRDTVTVDGKALPQHERTRLFLFNKPRGLVTTSYDPEGRPTIFSVLPKHLPRLITIGRLDLNTEGLLLLTNDGGLARVLEHPQTGWLRRYRVRAHGTVSQAQLDALRGGITIDGIHYGPIEATLDRVRGANVWLTFALREGKNREVRNVLGQLGLQVNRLIRVSFGPFQLGELAEGAVEEVRTRVLREQLGTKIAALADADFEGPLLTPAEVRPERKVPSRHPEPLGAQRRAAKRGGQGRPSFEGRLRRPPQDDGERFVRGGNGERPHKPRPWRGRGRDRPVPESASANETPRRTESGLVTDRKGRRVPVQRVQPDAAAQALAPPQQPARQRGRPPRDRRHGPRPSRPQGKRDRP